MKNVRKIIHKNTELNLEVTAFRLKLNPQLREASDRFFYRRIRPYEHLTGTIIWNH